MTSTAPLLQAAATAAQRGHWPDAERLWSRVLELEPANGPAHHALGVQAFKRRDLAAARHHLWSAMTASPLDPTIAMSLAVVLREQGDVDAEMSAIDAALAADAYFLPALLARGSCLERRGQGKAAASAYMNALRAAPPEAAWPPAYRDQLLHARRVTDAHGRELAAFLGERLAGVLGGLAPAQASRFREACSIVSGQSQPYLAQCSRLLVPRLPAIPFFERSHFPWAEALESKTGEITAELTSLLASQEADFHPYVAYDAGTPVGQWKHLNHSRRWSSFFLWRDGAPVRDAQSRCPATTEALREVHMADLAGLCPNAMFSALAPRTHIPPHHGETNARLVVHLPLIVPEGCTYRVGFERRQWKVGEILAFDDSIEHEARNDSDELRVVLIFDVWNPLLSKEEREAVRVLSAAATDFHVDG